MWAHKNQIINLLIIFFMTLVLCSVQATLWPTFLSQSVAPLMWLNVMLYIVLFRAPTHALMINYGLTLVIHAFTAVPFGIFITTVALLTASGSFIRQRLFWPSTRYFVIASFLFTIAYHIFYLILSLTLENNPANLNLFARVFEVLLTALTSAPIYWLMFSIDKVTEIDLIPESSGDQE